MNNTIDITDVTDRVLDIYMRTQGGEDGIVVDHLTPTELRQFADLMGWERGWAPEPSTPADADTFDYEGAILDQADERDGEYL